MIYIHGRKRQNHAAEWGVGCGIAGWRDIEIAPLFRKASEFDNVALPEEFRDILNRR